MVKVIKKTMFKYPMFTEESKNINIYTIFVLLLEKKTKNISSDTKPVGITLMIGT